MSETATAPERSGAAGGRALRTRLLGGGTAGNERLTAVTGAVLIVLLAVIGVTILRVRQLLWPHLFVGMLLLGPVALKLASTVYRFARYYTGDRAYRRHGAPHPLLRALGPLVVVLTVVVFASGVALLFAGPSSRGALLPLHKVSFIAWLAFTAVHVLAHLPALPAALRGDYARGRADGLAPAVPGRDGRRLALAASLVAGTVLALLVVPEFSAWVHSAEVLRGDG